METIFQDIRYALRLLVKSPAFTSVAVLTLALGIGANTAIFTVVNALLLKMLPVKDAQGLVVIGNPASVGDGWHGTPATDFFSYPLYREFRDRTSVFSGLAAAGMEDGVDVDAGTMGTSTEQRPNARLVTGNYFSVVGVDAAAGRLLTESDDTAEGANPVVVLSYGYWKRAFALSPAVLGKTIRLNGSPFTVVGVAQENFSGDVVGDNFDIFAPLSMQPQIMRNSGYRNSSRISWLLLIGRLKPGVSLAQARTDVNLVFRQALKGDYGASITAEDHSEIDNAQIQVGSGSNGLSSVRVVYRLPLLLLMAIVGIVLLIACVNVANLLLARAAARSKEVAVRLAIGATRSRLLRQLLTESLLLALFGGICGVLLSVWGVRLLLVTLGSERVFLSLSPDGRVLSFALMVCLFTGILFGIVPAWHAVRREVSRTLKDAPAPTGTRSRFGWGKSLIAGQVALSLLVLFGAALLVRSLQKLVTQDMGYDSQRIVIAHVEASPAGYKGDRMKQMARELSQRLAALPGVKSVTYSQLGLFSGGETSNSIIVPGFNPAKRDDSEAREDSVGPGYFDALGIPILVGRGIGGQDTTSSTRVAVINEAMMKYFFHGENPLGRQFEIDNEEYKGKPLTVIGVSKNAKDHGEFLREAMAPRFYVAFQQDTPKRVLLEVITGADAESAIADVRSQIKSFVSNLPIASIYTVRQRISQNVASEIALAKLSTFFAVLALLLACIGLYGIMSYTVAGQTREIGVRVALGAQRRDVLRLVLGEGLIVVGAGLAAGVPLAFASGRLLRSFLFGLRSTDPWSLIGVVLLLAVVAATASLLPARRAMKVDPVIALKYE